MTTALIYLVVMILVAAVVFLLAALVFGRGEELAPLPPGSSPTRLPSQDITADDVYRVRFQLVLRGYKMSEVDWVMRRLGAEIDDLRARVQALEAEGQLADNSGGNYEAGYHGGHHRAAEFSTEIISDPEANV
jgi:DivIVA domain-containing protein